MLNQRLERVALRDRDVVTADLVAVAKLIDPNELRERELQALGITLEIR